MTANKIINKKRYRIDLHIQLTEQLDGETSNLEISDGLKLNVKITALTFRKL